ncbi:MAG: LysM peptidoglycan-binding domain-containing protein [Chloroflexota bacterium]|nr:MAG: LysM peptidoglycan-binding domain-containing protein [Chloroflexota bacterium]
MKYNLTPAELVELNSLGSPDLLSVGQLLRIGKQRAPDATQHATVPSAPAQSADQTTEYTVQEGETLWDIAAKLNMTPAELVQLNDLSSPDLLTVGQRLQVGNSPAGAAAPSSPSTSRPYVVQSGDTLSSIAVRFDITTEQLLDLNSIPNPDALQPEQVLYLP